MKTPDTDPVTRHTFAELQKLFAHLKEQALKGIEQGEAPANIKRQLREKLAAGAHVLRGALDDAERYARRE